MKKEEFEAQIGWIVTKKEPFTLKLGIIVPKDKLLKLAHNTEMASVTKVKIGEFICVIYSKAKRKLETWTSKTLQDGIERAHEKLIALGIQE